MKHSPLQTSSELPGGLYVVATPIGNLEDITLRAIRILKEADILACEDTRHTQKLLNHYQISGKKLLSYHNFNEEKQSHHLIDALSSGQIVALVSDAGTPAVSDPGFFLVRLAHQHHIPVYPIPGPSALTAAVSISPIPMTRFHFEGFLPHKKGRQTRLKYLSELEEGIVLYESPFRIEKLLDEILTFFGDRQVGVCRELSKLHEEYIFSRASEHKSSLTNQKIRGEFVILVEGKQSFLKTSSQTVDEDHT